MTDFHVHPDHVYDTGSLVIGLDLPSATLGRARREGRLRFSRQGRRVFYLGAWIIDWLASTDRRQEVAVGR
jgi:hypothetical protein